MENNQDFRYIPKRKLTEAEKQIIMLKIQNFLLNMMKNVQRGKDINRN